jgi:DNA-binding transcriptional MerR regulator
MAVPVYDSSFFLPPSNSIAAIRALVTEPISARWIAVSQKTIFVGSPQKLLCKSLARARNASGGREPSTPMSPHGHAVSKPAKSADILIPEKLYFRIGEVARLCRLPAYVLRFWETEFPQLKPVKSSTGQRMYRRKDVESVLKIKQLLYEDGFTIPGARQHLRAEGKGEKNQAPLPFPGRSGTDLKYIRQGLRDILSILSARH